MTKYLGSKITAFSAVVVPILICFPLPFGISALCAEISIATVMLFLGSVLCAVIWGIYVKDIGIQLYSWGRFTNNSVQVITGFKKSGTIIYKKCFGCGIGYYTHGILNSQCGSKIYFIFLSYDKFNECFRSKINLWKPSHTQIKVEYSEELYAYLLTVLPKTQLQMLVKDHKKYFAKIGDSPVVPTEKNE